MRDPECPNRLIGDGRWLCETDGTRVLARKVASGSEKDCGYLFVNGRLRRMLSGNKEIDVAPDSGRMTAECPGDCWSTRPTILELGKPPDIWQDSGRLRLWYKNPNNAGILFAEILCLATAGLFAVRTPCLATTIPLFVALLASAFAVFQTGSRGALVAAACGVLAVLSTRVRQLLRGRSIAAGLCVLALAAAAIWTSPYKDRLTVQLFARQGDESNDIRLNVLSAAPRMFANSPTGWGFGQSGRAFVDWYQDQDGFVCDDLISSHLTFLTEGGWLFSAAYLGIWAFALILALVTAFRGGNPMLAGLLTALAIGGAFNPCLKEWTLYTLPAAVLVFSLPSIRTLSRRRVAACAVVGLALALAGIAALAIWGRHTPSKLHIACNCGAVTLGDKEAAVGIVDDGYTMNGGFWWLQGRSVRRWFQRHPDASCCFVRDLDNLPKSVRRVVLIGLQGDRFIDAWRNKRLQGRKIDEVAFLSPSFRIDQVPDEFLAQFAVSGYRGEFLAATDDSKPQDWMRAVRGTELYLPKWLSLAMGVTK